MTEIKEFIRKKSGNRNEESTMKSIPSEKESTSVCPDTPLSLETIATYEDHIQSSVIPSFHSDVFFHKERSMQPWKKKNQYIVMPTQKHCTNTKLRDYLKQSNTLYNNSHDQV